VDIVLRVERREFPFDRLFDLDTEQLGDLVRMASAGPDLKRALSRFPRVKLEVDCRPLGSDELELDLVVEPLWTSSDDLDSNELFWVFVQDPTNTERGLLAYDQIMFTERSAGRSAHKLVRCAMTKSPVIYVDVVSDRWIGAECRRPIALLNMTVPVRASPLMGLKDMRLRREPFEMDLMLSNAWEVVEHVLGDANGDDHGAFVCLPAPWHASPNQISFTATLSHRISY
jgi:pre-mRNA-splicing helicase BRR2